MMPLSVVTIVKRASRHMTTPPPTYPPPSPAYNTTLVADVAIQGSSALPVERDVSGREHPWWMTPSTSEFVSRASSNHGIIPVLSIVGGDDFVAPARVGDVTLAVERRSLPGEKRVGRRGSFGCISFAGGPTPRSALSICAAPPAEDSDLRKPRARREDLALGSVAGTSKTQGGQPSSYPTTSAPTSPSVSTTTSPTVPTPLGGFLRAQVPEPMAGTAFFDLEHQKLTSTSRSTMWQDFGGVVGRSTHLGGALH